MVKKNEWHCIPNPNKKEEKNLYRKYLAQVKKIEKESEEKGLKMTWSYDYLDDNCKEIRGDKFQPIYISKDQLKQNEFTEEDIQNVISKWERKPSYEFLLPDWHAAVEAGRWVNRGRFRNDTPEDESMDYHRISRNFHLLNTYQLRKLYRNKISYETSKKTNTFYIVKIKVQLNNRKEFTIYKPGICANKVLGGRYVKNNENKIQSVIEVRNIHWHVAACLEEKTQYYMNARPWLPMLYSHELIDSDMHGYFNDFYHKDFEMFEERYGACKNEIWNFNRKILEEMKNAQKRRFFSYAENSYLHTRGDIDYKENKKRDREVEKIYNQRIKEIEKLRKRLRRDYFKKIPKPKESDNLWDYLKGGHTEFRIWDDSEENLFVWIKLLLSFEKEKLDKYKNKPEVVFQRSI